MVAIGKPLTVVRVSPVSRFGTPGAPPRGLVDRAVGRRRAAFAPAGHPRWAMPHRDDRGRAVSAQALAVTPDFARAVATPLLASLHLLLENPNATVPLAAIAGAAAAASAQRQGNLVRAACTVLAVASPFVMQQAVGMTVARAGITLARVPMQAVLDTGLAAIAATSLALLAALVRPPWAGDAGPAPLEGPVAPMLARFAGAAVAGPVVFHAVMAAALPPGVQAAVRAATYLVPSLFFIAARVG